MAMDNKTLGMIMALGGGGNGGGGGSLIPVPTAQDAGKMLIVGVVQGEAGYQLVAFDEPMKFKGTLGTGGTISTLPTASTENEGYVYIVITDGTYAGQEAEAGDQFISNGEAWWKIPSGDDAFVVSDTLTAGSTTITFTNSKIKPTSFIGVSSGTWYTDAEQTTGSVTLTFPEQSTDMLVQIMVAN